VLEEKSNNDKNIDDHEKFIHSFGNTLQKVYVTITSTNQKQIKKKR